MPENGRIVGVDYGKKRVGIAIADPLRIFARPLGTYDPREAVEELKRMHAQDRLDTVVVGWPLLPDGSEGAATAVVQEYINRLRNALPGVQIVPWDERYTSEMAGRLLREGNPKRGIRKADGRLDAAAAAVILQDYLDR